MTSRAEYRLLLRQDNADIRLREIGYQAGLVSEEDYKSTLEKQMLIHEEMERLKKTVVGAAPEIQRFLQEHESSPLKTAASLSELMCRPELSYSALAEIDPGRPQLSSAVIAVSYTHLRAHDAEQLPVILNQEQEEKFILYYELLVQWNEVMNLTAITEFNEVLKKHFIDSLSLIRAVPELEEKKLSLIDVGTGAGFPGIPLKIAYPGLKVTLLDSLNKRIKFLNEVIDKLGLEDIEAVHGRAEDYAKPSLFREKYDICVSRAVANLSTLSEYCLPFVRVGGQFISYKSEKIEEEAAAAEKAIHILGGDVKDKKDFYLPDSDIYRILYVIEKKSVTPKKYPRKAGLPAKEPIVK